MSKPPIIFSWRFFKMVGLIFREWWNMRRAMKQKRSSGHLDSSERSAEFHRLRSRGR